MTDEEFSQTLNHWREVFQNLRKDHPSPLWDDAEKAFMAELHRANGRATPNTRDGQA